MTTTREKREVVVRHTRLQIDSGLTSNNMLIRLGDKGYDAEEIHTIDAEAALDFDKDGNLIGVTVSWLEPVTGTPPSPR